MSAPAEGEDRERKDDVFPRLHSVRLGYTAVKRTIFSLLIFGCTVSCRMPSNDTQAALLKWEKDFAMAVVSNDADSIGKFLPDDWVIVDPNGEIIDRARFLGAIKSGMLTHELMESDDVHVRAYSDCAVLTALTRTKAKFGGQAFTTQERATDVFVKRTGH